MSGCSSKGLHLFQYWFILLYFKAYITILVSVLFHSLGINQIFATGLFVSAFEVSHR